MLSSSKNGRGRILAAVLVAASLAGIVSHANATTVTWSLSGNGNWDASTANWTSSTYADGDAAVFPDSVTGGTITVTNVTSNGGVTPASVEFSHVNTTGGNYTFVAGTGVTNGIEGSGTLTLDASYHGTVAMNLANTYTGGTTINGGTLNLELNGTNLHATNVYQLGSGAVTLNGGELEFSPNGSPNTAYNYDLTNAVTLNGGTVFANDGQDHLTGTVNVTGTGSTLAAQYGGKDLYIDGALTGSGALTTTHFGATNFGIGAIRFTGAGNSYSGTLTVAGGGISIDNNTALSNANIVDNSGGSTDGTGVAFNGATNDTNVSIGSLAGNANGRLALSNGSAAVTLTVGGGSSAPGAYTFSGILSGSGSIVKTGSGTLVLEGTNTYSGGTVINNGTLSLGNGGGENVAALGAGAVTVNTGGTLAMSPGSTSNSYSIANAVNLDGGTIDSIDGEQHLTGSITLGSGTSTLESGYVGKELYIDGAVSGSGNLSLTGFGGSFTGPNTIHFSNSSNTYTGTVTVNQSANGTILSIDNNTALGAASVSLNSNGGSIATGGVHFGAGVTTPQVAALTEGTAGVLVLPGGINLTTTNGLSLGGGKIGFSMGTPGNGSELFATGGNFTVSAPVTINLVAGTGFVNGNVYQLLNWAGATTAPAITLADFTLGTNPGTESLTISGSALYYGSVPEPANLAMLAIGGMGLLFFRRRRSVLRA